jgi:hypothetical protein
MKTVEYADYLPVRALPATAWEADPKHLVFRLARYKFAAKMLEGYETVAEIGCAEGFASRIVAQSVERLDLYDMDPKYAEVAGGKVHDIVLNGPLPRTYDAVFMIDVIEHIDPILEHVAMANIQRSLGAHGVFIAGAPTLEFQKYASSASRAHHVNCRSGQAFKRDMLQYFRNVFHFSMSDEVVHIGFAPMACYSFVLCCGVR